MKKQLAAVMAATGMMFATVSIAQADEHIPPEHAHVLVTGVETNDAGFPFGTTSYRKCHELAAGQALKLNAHHESIHTGTAGYGNYDVGITRAGNFVVPLAPFTNLADCDEVESFLNAVIGTNT